METDESRWRYDEDWRNVLVRWKMEGKEEESRVDVILIETIT